eukprot:8799786-Lingulodinium_polyedra.AAC.1
MNRVVWKEARERRGARPLERGYQICRAGGSARGPRATARRRGIGATRASEAKPNQANAGQGGPDRG